jgi:hypothetical protein
MDRNFTVNILKLSFDISLSNIIKGKLCGSGRTDDKLELEGTILFFMTKELSFIF